MKKSFYLALAAVTMTLFACNSKPATSDQQAEEQAEQVETVLEETEEFVEEALEAGEPLAEETLAEEPVSEEPATEETPAEEPADDEPVYMVVEHRAVPGISDEEWKKLLVINLNDVDPEASEARVIVQVIIEKDGRLTNPVVKRSTGNDKLDAYALEYATTKLPRFKEPARQGGRPVRTNFVFPIYFKKL